MLVYQPENSPFKSVYCDIVHRCNMECKNCYLPNRSIPDLPKKKVIAFFKRFKKSTEFRFIGGEPTLHKDLPEFIKIATDLGHRTTIATNGLRTSRFDYLYKLKLAGLKTVYLSMTGWDDDSIYQTTDNMSCAKRKIQALDNIIGLKLRLSVGIIIIKNLNEQVLKKVLNSFNEKKYKGGTSFEFRNVGQVGRYMIKTNKNYKFNELKKLVMTQLQANPKVNDIFEDNNYSYAFKYGKYRINITNWEGVSKGFDKKTNLIRGRLTQDYKVAPFLDHIKENEGNY